MGMRWIRFLNRIGWRNDPIICIRVEETWRWSSHLGERTEGKCSECDEPIYFEKQNGVFRKICSRCHGFPPNPITHPQNQEPSDEQSNLH